MGSKRLPEKPMIPIQGKPMILHVVQKALKSKKADRVIVATDRQEIAKTVQGSGFGKRAEVKMTSPGCKTGTDRVASLAVTVMDEQDNVVNLQGDLPFADPRMVDQLFVYMEKHPRTEMATVARRLPLPDREGIYRDHNAVKVVRDNRGKALYFSRHPIPHNAFELGYFHHHIGMYAYKAHTLRTLLVSAQSDAEKAERLEQLRALGLGIDIQVLQTEFEVGVEINTLQDWKRVRAPGDWREVKLETRHGSIAV